MKLHLVVFIPLSFAILDDHFLKFLNKKYWPEIAERLNRADLGPNGDGSFGGGNVLRTRRPVVLVHGLRNKAGYLWKNRKILGENGWQDHHVLATSWGMGDQGFMMGMSEGMKCDYVKQIRYMLIATMCYYRSDIDVIAYSMGSPIARKVASLLYANRTRFPAILGGYCADTGEYLGRRLSHRINTFVSVAGANQGSALCDFSFPGVCGDDIGLNCKSKFLRDVNSKVGYEGAHRYFIHSTTDDMVGTMTSCGKVPGAIEGAEEVKIEMASHDDTMFERLDEQLKVMLKQYPND